VRDAVDIPAQRHLVIERGNGNGLVRRRYGRGGEARSERDAQRQRQAGAQDVLGHGCFSDVGKAIVGAKPGKA